MKKMKSGCELLQRYANDGDENAFQEIVERHLNLVYSAALRITGDSGLAREVSQIVFSDLARKAKRLSGKVVLSGWLYRDATFVASKLIRTESRRMKREQQAVAEMDFNDAEENKLWQRIRPVIDDAMGALKPKDRDVVVLRFFEGLTFRETGDALGISEDAARMRVERALDRLKDQLGKLGVNSTSSALAKILTASAITLAPAGLASGVVGIALESAGIGTLLTKLLTMTNLKTTLAGLALTAGIATPIAVQHNANSKLDASQMELTQLQSELNALREDNEVLRIRQQIEEVDRELTEQERLELLKLRSEVGSLRRQVEEQANQLAANEMKTPEEEIEEKTPRRRGVAGFSTKVDANVESGQTLVLGGWELESDRHRYIVLTPEILSENGSQTQVLLKGTLLEVADEFIPDFGLPQFPAETLGISFSGTMQSERFDLLLEEYQDISGAVAIISRPKIMANDQQEARISIPDDPVGGFRGPGETEVTQQGITILPVVSPDGTSVSLLVDALWFYDPAGFIYETETP